MKFITKNISKFFALLDQVLVSGTNFGLGVLITRFISIEAYGEFSLFWMVYLFLQGFSIAFLGLPIQVISQQKKDSNQYLEASIQLTNLVLCFVLGFLYLGFGVYHFINPNMVTEAGYWLFPLVIVLFLKHDVHRKYFYTKNDIKKVFSIDFCGYFFQLPILFVLSTYYTIGFNEIVYTLLFTITLSQCSFYILKTKNKMSFNIHQLPFKENWIYGRYLIVTNILQWFSGNYLIIIAASILGNAAVGVIKIFQNLMGILHILFLTLENIVPPKASYLFNASGKKALFTYIKKIGLFTGVIYIIVLVLLSISGKHIIQTVYGFEYTKYTFLIHYFILVYVFVFLGTLSQIVIKTLQLNISILIAYVITVITTAIIAKPLINNYNITGVVYGFGILQIITLITYTSAIKFSKS